MRLTFEQSEYVEINNDLKSIRVKLPIFGRFEYTFTRVTDVAM